MIFGLISDEEISYVKTLDGDVLYNSNEALNRSKTFEELELKDIQMTYKDGSTRISGKLKNNGDTVHEEEQISIILLDKSGEEIARMGGVINKTEAGEESNFLGMSTLNYIDAYDFKLERSE